MWPLHLVSGNSCGNCLATPRCQLCQQKKILWTKISIKGQKIRARKSFTIVSLQPYIPSSLHCTLQPVDPFSSSPFPAHSAIEHTYIHPKQQQRQEACHLVVPFTSPRRTPLGEDRSRPGSPATQRLVLVSRRPSQSPRRRISAWPSPFAVVLVASPWR